MGSLTSRPKITTVKTVSVPAVSQVATTTSSASTSDNTDASTDSTQEQSAQAIQDNREQNLLRRSRGRIGTVLTSFRGALTTESGASENAAQGKTLLGE